MIGSDWFLLRRTDSTLDRLYDQRSDIFQFHDLLKEQSELLQLFTEQADELMRQSKLIGSARQSGGGQV
ncbi:MAG: hypothetical protein ACI841_001467 [Planctomycetota bacterium]